MDGKKIISVVFVVLAAVFYAINMLCSKLLFEEVPSTIIAGLLYLAAEAGKTIIINLINRFYDIQSGKIRYDGINIGKIKKSDLRKSLDIVLRDVNLFTGAFELE